MKSRLIVALDVPTFAEARVMVRKLKKGVSIFKVGLELFTAAGPHVVKMIHDEGRRVFLDLKFHDIPNTVARACATAADLGVFMTNIHASGGPEMMKAASQAIRAYKGKKPILLGVTVLTSDPKRAGTSKEVVRLAREAKAAGLNGVVCSALEAAKVRKACGRKLVIVTPGIRPTRERTKVPFGSERSSQSISRWGGRGESGITPRYDDQKRVATPSWALQNGADYLVVGRPILQSSDPQKVISEILTEMQGTPI